MQRTFTSIVNESDRFWNYWQDVWFYSWAHVEIPCTVGWTLSRSFNYSGTRVNCASWTSCRRHIFFGRGLPLATAMLATESGISKAFVKQVRVKGSSEVPSHMKGLLDDIRNNAPPEVRHEVVRLITQFSDVFTVCDLKQGEFAVIEHQIETWNARPINQRIRSTPAVFQGEEEVHEDRMLAAEVIQSSTSDWVAVFALIRKKRRFCAVVR